MHTSSESTLTDWVSEHKKLLFGGLMAVVALGLGVEIFQNLKQKKIMAAASAEEQVKATLNEVD